MKRLTFLKLGILIGLGTVSLNAQFIDWLTQIKNKPTIDVRTFGAKCDGVTDDTAKIQLALNSIPDSGGTAEFPNGTCVISNTLWIHSNTGLKGQGGMSKSTQIKRKDGMATDAIVAGIWSGTTSVRTGTYLDWVGGLPYDDFTPGANISIQGIYINGNGANAGTPTRAPNPPLSAYRGSGIWLQFVKGVYINDVATYQTPNDGIWIGGCARVMVQNCWFNSTLLINPEGADTKNGLTIAGTMQGVLDDTADSLIVSNCIAEETEDIGIAIQSRWVGGVTEPTFGGSIIVSNNVTRHNRDYGIIIEGYEGSFFSKPVHSVIMANNISDHNGYYYTTFSAGMGVSYQAVDVIVTGNIIKNASATGLVVSGHDKLHITNNIIDGWSVDATTHDNKGIFIYNDAGNPYMMTNLVVEGNTLIGPTSSSYSTIGMGITGIVNAHIKNNRIINTLRKTSSDLSGSCILIEPTTELIMEGNYCENLEGAGFVIATDGNITLDNNIIKNYGIANTAGFMAGARILRKTTGATGRVNINNIRITGGGSRTPGTAGLSIDAFPKVNVTNSYIEDLTYSGNFLDGIGIIAYGVDTDLKNNTIRKAADRGIYVDGGVLRYNISGNTVYKSGTNASAGGKVGIDIAPSGTGATRYGIIANNQSYDDGTATQVYGFRITNDNNSAINFYGNQAWGNVTAPLNGDFAVTQRNRIFGNDFEVEKSFRTAAGLPWRSDGVTWNILGTPANGSMIYCTNCTIANPCAAGGTGAFAKRLNGVWVCN